MLDRTRGPWMARRKESDGGLGLVLILGLIIALAAIPRQIWIAVAVIGGIWLTYRIYKHFAPKPTSLLIEPMVERVDSVSCCRAQSREAAAGAGVGQARPGGKGQGELNSHSPSIDLANRCRGSIGPAACLRPSRGDSTRATGTLARVLCRYTWLRAGAKRG